MSSPLANLYGLLYHFVICFELKAPIEEEGREGTTTELLRILGAKSPLLVPDDDPAAIETDRAIK